MKKILILDTTLRDGEQIPGAKLDLNEKLRIAKQLNRLNVDYIEAGFSASSKGDFESVKEIAKNFSKEGPVITALSRAVKSDIDLVYNSVKYAKNPMIHIVLGSSNIHVNKKLKKSSDYVIDMGSQAVKYAKNYVNEVQYSTEDATRSDFEYLWKTIESVIKAGATIINIPDTVGCAVPEEFGYLIEKINYRIKNLNEKVILSVHCHNDIGLATANSLAAVKNGADKVECTINGLGERAGNAALEEVVMGIKSREDYYGSFVNINNKEIKNISNLVSSLMGLRVQVNKAITGDNAFSHSSGIHQDGLIKDREVYESISPKDVGIDDMEIVLTARSGKNALKNIMDNYGYSLTKKVSIEEIHKGFLILADNKKEIYLNELNTFFKHLMEEGKIVQNRNKFIDLYELENIQIMMNSFCTATIKLKKGNNTILDSYVGYNQFDVIIKLIKKMTDLDFKIVQYNQDTMQKISRVFVKVSHKGKIFSARSVEKEFTNALALAIVEIVNKILITSNVVNEIREKIKMG
jgi:2-isopropylmalate synthase